MLPSFPGARAHPIQGLDADSANKRKEKQHNGVLPQTKTLVRSCLSFVAGFVMPA